MKAKSRTLIDRRFEDFYQETYPGILRTLAFTLGDVELAREATDEAMARCYERWDDVTTYSNPAGWVYRVGLNWSRSRLRRRRPLVLLRRQTVAEPEYADPAIAAALRSLSVDLRAVVVCRMWADWSVAETAEALGIKPGTVKSRMHRALFILKSQLMVDDVAGSGSDPERKAQ